MDALVRFKNSIKPDIIVINNYILAFEDDLQRQNNTTQSLSELIKKQETSTEKRLLKFKNKLNALMNQCRKKVLNSD